MLSLVKARSQKLAMGAVLGVWGWSPQSPEVKGVWEGQAPNLRRLGGDKAPSAR